MGSIDGNGTHELRMTDPAPESRPGADAPMARPEVSGRPLDPSSIGKLVEQEVETLLGAAAAEADRISSTAMAVVRQAEAKIAALQLDLDAAVMELRGLAERTEATTPSAEPPLAAEPTAAEQSFADTPSVGEPMFTDEHPVQDPAFTAGPPVEPGLPAVLTEPPAAMQRMADPERRALDMPASDDVVRLLREKMS